MLALLRDSGGSATRGQGVEPLGQDSVAGVDVAAAGEGLADQCVGFVVRAGVAGVDADGVGDQFGLDVQDLLAGLTWPGGNRAGTAR